MATGQTLGLGRSEWIDSVCVTCGGKCLESTEPKYPNPEQVCFRCAEVGRALVSLDLREWVKDVIAVAIARALPAEMKRE